MREEVEEVKEEVMEEVKEAEMGKIAVKTRTALILAAFEAEAAILLNRKPQNMLIVLYSGKSTDLCTFFITFVIYVMCNSVAG